MVNIIIPVQYLQINILAFYDSGSSLVASTAHNSWWDLIPPYSIKTLSEYKWILQTVLLQDKMTSMEIEFSKIASLTHFICFLKGHWLFKIVPFLKTE
jgi:hypothetical protein